MDFFNGLLKQHQRKRILEVLNSERFQDAATRQV